ncbi:MAG: ABC transporter permease [Flavobacteriales bacterium]
MLKHYIKFAIRNFRSNKTIFAGSLATLCLGALCISLLFSYVYNEFTMDDFHEKGDNIYMLMQRTSSESKWEGIEANLFFNFDYKDYPELDNLVTIKKYPEGSLKLIHDGTVFTSEGLVADSTFFQIFDFKLKIGNKKVLAEPDAIVLTEKFAKKIFADTDPIGKEIKVVSNRESFYTVKGIVKSLSSNSSIDFDFILPTSKDGNQYSRSGSNFILVKESFKEDAFINKIKDIGHVHDQFKDNSTSIIPFKSLYFNEESVELKGIIEKYGDKKTINTLIVIMLVILIISALNFSNLWVINTNTNVKHAAINMVNGAEKKHIIFQKGVEVLLLLLLSACVISIIYRFVLPIFNSFTGVELSPPVWKIVLLNGIILALLVTLASIYPIAAAYRMSLINSLKNQTFLENQLIGRKFVAIIQYTLTLILIISSIVVARQLHLMLSKDLGFNTNNIIRAQLFHRVPRPQIDSDFTEEKWNDYQAEKERQKNTFYYVQNQLKMHSSIQGFTQGESPLKPSLMPWKKRGSQKEYSSQNLVTVVMPSYVDFFNLKMSEGRFFEEGRDESRAKQVVINEAAKKFWNITDISKALLLNKFWDDKDGYEIIGVVKDFNNEHLSKKPQPLIMVYFGNVDIDINNDFFRSPVARAISISSCV